MIPIVRDEILESSMDSKHSHRELFKVPTKVMVTIFLYFKSIKVDVSVTASRHRFLKTFIHYSLVY